ncbi:hypothetical protein NQ315_010972, partial [Exocentrus adspersus]
EEEKVEIFTCYIKNYKNKREARGQYKVLYPNRPTPLENTFRSTYLPKGSYLHYKCGMSIITVTSGEYRNNDVVDRVVVTP